MRSTTVTPLYFFFALWMVARTAAAVVAFCFASVAFSGRHRRPPRWSHNFQTALSISNAMWTSLTDDGGVKIQVFSSSSPPGDVPTAVEDLKGKDVTVEYIGYISSRNWSVDDVIDCWLPDQGISSLAPELFRAFKIDGKRLVNSKRFSTKFILEGLGVTKEAKQTTLFEAAQDLKISDETHPEGIVFDKNLFTFRPGKGQVIKAFDLAIQQMKVGQTALLTARCDYAYGRKGLKSMGKVLVPPYATVQYEVTFVSVK